MTGDEIMASWVIPDDVDNCESENETGNQPKEVITLAEATAQMEKHIAYLERKMETTLPTLIAVKCLSTVSYTHLDVYKRQALNIAFSRPIVFGDDRLRERGS